MKKLIFMTLLFTALSVFSVEYYVDASRPDDTSAATNWSTAKRTIQAAVDLTADGDTVWVTNGIYYPVAQIISTNDVTIRSVNGRVVTIVDGQNTNRCFYIGGSTVIDGFTIQNGIANYPGGGGVYCDEGGAILNCIIRNNTAIRGSGGGIHSEGDAEATIYNSLIYSNYANSAGGGVMFDCLGSVSNCVISNNSSGSFAGGLALYGWYGKGVVTDCIIRDNFCNEVGGGIYCSYGGIIQRSIIIGNTSGSGGGIRCDTGCTIQNCVVAYNQANYAGGVIYSSSSKIQNCTVIGNTATNAVGGVHGSGGNLENSIVYFNTAPTNANHYNVEGETPYAKYTCTTPINDLLAGAGCITNAPLFVDTANRDFHLQAGSLCINAGSNGYVQTATDLNGRDRILNGTVDMGAYEHLTAYVSDDSGDDANSGQSWTNAKQTIQAAVDLTVDGDTVWVTNGTYDISSEISVTNTITVQSVNGSEVTIVDGGGRNRCFNLYDSACAISGFTIRNGSARDKLGGGVYCADTTPIVSNCLFFANEAIWIYASPGWSGGGMFKGTAINCVFDSNGAMFGGGMDGGIARRCVFTNNYGIGGPPWGNSYGAGMNGGEAHSCLFVDNDAFAGGGVAAAKVYNCVFADNVAQAGGGAFDSQIYNSIFFLNEPIFGYEHTRDSEVHNSCIPDLVDGVNGNITNAPVFVDVVGGDFRLMSNSPCINWGNNSVVSTVTDLDGNPRIIEDVVDMGAYEYQDIIGLADSDGDGIPDDWERQHGGNQNPNRTCSNGVNKVREAYIAGLNPNDPDSEFLTTILPGSILQWHPCSSGRVYSVWWSTNLLENFQPLETNIPWTVNSFTDSVHDVHGQLFYKIDVEIDDRDTTSTEI